jgi:hypothetical protein
MSRTAAVVGTAAAVSHDVIAARTRERIVVTGGVGGNRFRSEFTSHRLPVPLVLIGSPNDGLR